MKIFTIILSPSPYPNGHRQTEGGQPSVDPGTVPERVHPENEELDPTRQRELDDQVDKHRDDVRK